MTLMKIPGETDDHIGVYIPSLQLFVIGDDLYKSYPNLYSIRGTKPRPVLEWARSCDKVTYFFANFGHITMTFLLLSSTAIHLQFYLR